MVSVKETINSGAWLQCEYKDSEELIKFRLKINSFRKLNLSEIDKPEEISMLDGNLTLVEVEVVNLCKEALKTGNVVNYIVLIDQEGYKFNVFIDHHLCWASEFAKKTRLNRFYSEELMPKIKTRGAFAFQLPDDDGAEYSISINNDGIVQEV